MSIPHIRAASGLQSRLQAGSSPYFKCKQIFSSKDEILQQLIRNEVILQESVKPGLTADYDLAYQFVKKNYLEMREYDGSGEATQEIDDFIT